MTHDVKALRELLEKATPGEWKAVAQGGSSTVIAPTKPERNDTRIPAYGYDETRGHCIAYPFMGERMADLRLDFVSFSHADAAAIVAAVNWLRANIDALSEKQVSPSVSDVECVAMALHEHEESWNDTAWEYLPAGTQELFRGQGRAALAAIRRLEGNRT